MSTNNVKNFEFRHLVKSGNDEYYTPEYAVEPIVKYIPAGGGVVWCPFDTEESNYVKMISKTHKVVFSHINNGQDFFNTEVPKNTVAIISNPPYSIKTEVLERLFELGKPFAMLVGVVGLFESKRRVKMFSNNEFEILYLDKRVAYMTDYQSGECDKRPPFQSFYICHNLLDQEIKFAAIKKPSKRKMA